MVRCHSLLTYCELGFSYVRDTNLGIRGPLPKRCKGVLTVASSADLGYQRGGMCGRSCKALFIQYTDFLIVQPVKFINHCLFYCLKELFFFFFGHKEQISYFSVKRLRIESFLLTYYKKDEFFNIRHF